MPLRLATGRGVLAFFSATRVFGTPGDITLSELALESFFPADGATDELVRLRFRGRFRRLDAIPPILLIPRPASVVRVFDGRDDLAPPPR